MSITFLRILMQALYFSERTCISPRVALIHVFVLSSWVWALAPTAHADLKFLTLLLSLLINGNTAKCHQTRLCLLLSFSLIFFYCGEPFWNLFVLICHWFATCVIFDLWSLIDFGKFSSSIALADWLFLFLLMPSNVYCAVYIILVQRKDASFACRYL